MKDEYDFSKSKSASEIPHLAKLQSEGKSRITIMLDNDILDFYRDRAKFEGIGYQTLINAALREAVQAKPLDEEALRRILREELKTS